MGEYELDRFEVNGFTVIIEYDPFAESPHDWELRGADAVMWGRNWDFPNDAGINLEYTNGWADVAERLVNPFAVVNEGTTEVLRRFKTEAEASAYIDTLPEVEMGYGIDGEDTEPALLVLPVWVYDHSGISLSAGDRSYPYDDRWDSAQAGVAYITPRIWAYLSDAPWTGSDEQVERATREIKNFVDEYGKYCNGEVYRFEVRDFDDEYIDSCGGFFDYDECEKEGRHLAETTEHEPKCTGELDRTTGQVEHERDCPVHDVNQVLDALRASGFPYTYQADAPLPDPGKRAE